MIRITSIIAFLLAITFNSFAQKTPMDTLGITNGSVHMKGSFPYNKFLKKYKGENELVIHIWYNPSGSSMDKKEIKVGKDEVYFLYGRNHKTGLSEMDFKFGSNAKAAFSKKKEKEMIEFIDFFEFEVFIKQNFNAYLAMEALERALE
ncbi:MAG: hypothetical protein ACI8ZN_000945 [Bacteroidia bacterium]|jgi:hypothetical protein